MKQAQSGRHAKGGGAQAGDPGLPLPGAALLIVDEAGAITRAAGWEDLAGSPPPAALPPAGESSDALIEAVAETVAEARKRRGLWRRFVEVETERRRYYAIAAHPQPRAGDGGTPRMAVLASEITEAFTIAPREGQAIRDLGHDLRSPLTSLSGAVELLQSGRVGALTQEQDRLLGMMQQGLQMMLTLIDDATSPYRAAAGPGNPGHPRAEAS